MDCSTFSNRTGVDDTTVGEESVGALRRQLEAAARGAETAQQELHEARRNYQTALDVQHHLAAELEAQRTGEERRSAELRARIHTLQEDVQSLRAERLAAVDAHTQNSEVLTSKIKELQDKLNFKAVEDQLHAETTPNGSNDELTNLKNDHNSLLSSLTEQKRVLEENVTVIASLKERLSELGEELSCSRGILESKKEELLSATEALHSAQSELTLANLELQRMRNEGSKHAAKGNSLFAEVDDKRQEMAKTLIQMKQQNIQLKRELGNKQAEVESLLSEKRTLWEEYTGHSGLLDAGLIKSYEQRITELTTAVESQRREFARWYSRQYESSSSEAGKWVAGLLEHLRTRCSHLTAELLESSVENLSKATEIRELHKKVASLRFKAFEAGSPQPDINSRATETSPRGVKDEVKLESQNGQEEITF